MKILALDPGDVHVGTAISDSLCMLARPLKTVSLTSLTSFLNEIIEKEDIKIIVMGYPKTMKGTISAQTQKVLDLKNEYEKNFSNIKWILWDERLSSKRAEKFKKGKEKEDKLRLHSIAAALILDSYLEFFTIHNTCNGE